MSQDYMTLQSMMLEMQRILDYAPNQSKVVREISIKTDSRGRIRGRVKTETNVFIDPTDRD